MNIYDNAQQPQHLPQTHYSPIYADGKKYSLTLKTNLCPTPIHKKKNIDTGRGTDHKRGRRSDSPGVRPQGKRS